MSATLKPVIGLQSSHLPKRRVTYIEQWKFYMHFWKKFVWITLHYLRS